MSEEIIKDLTTRDNSGKISEKAPANPEGGKADELNELKSKVEELSTKYSSSSTEGKRLAGLVDELKTTLEEKQEYILALEEANAAKNSKEETEVVKSVEVKTETKKESINPLLTKEGLNREIEKVIENKTKTDEAAKNQFNDALKVYPQLKNKSFSKLVGQEMKLSGRDITEACKIITENLKSLEESSEEESEPFVEGALGKSNPQHVKNLEDNIKSSLSNKGANAGLPGLV